MGGEEIQAAKKFQRQRNLAAKVIRATRKLGNSSGKKIRAARKFERQGNLGGKEIRAANFLAALIFSRAAR